MGAKSKSEAMKKLRYPLIVFTAIFVSWMFVLGIYTMLDKMFGDYPQWVANLVALLGLPVFYFFGTGLEKTFHDNSP